MASVPPTGFEPVLPA